VKVYLKALSLGQGLIFVQRLTAFFLACQAYALNMLAAQKPSQFASHSPASAIKDFHVSEFGSPEFECRLKKWICQ
jgi:hypothetical protein